MLLGSGSGSGSGIIKAKTQLPGEYKKEIAGYAVTVNRILRSNKLSKLVVNHALVPSTF